MEQNPQALQLEGLDTAREAVIKITGHGITQRGAAYIQELFGRETAISSAKETCVIAIQLPGHQEGNEVKVRRFISKVLNGNMEGVEITLS